jgi:hypothetical protein
MGWEREGVKKEGREREGLEERI